MNFPVRYKMQPRGVVGVEPQRLWRYREYDVSRQIERATIREFVEQNAHFLTGTVLDYGCGKRPYADVVALAGGTYVGWDLGDELCLDGPLDAVLCTQVLQYVQNPTLMCRTIHGLLRPGGKLIMTVPGAWPELENERWRFTEFGLRQMLDQAGFRVISLIPRCVIEIPAFELVMGWGILAEAI